MRQSSRPQVQPKAIVDSFYFWCTIVSAFLLTGLLFGNEPIVVQVLFLLMAALTRWRFAGVVLLLGVQIYLIFASSSLPWRTVPILDNSLTAVLLLLTVAFADRFRTARQIQREASMRFVGIRTPLSDANKQNADTVASRARRIGQVIGLVLAAIACVGFARLILMLLPADLNMAGRLRIRPGELRAIQFAALVLAALAVGWFFINELLIWRRLDRSQARLYLRSTRLQWLSPDLRRFATTRQRRMKKVGGKSS
jgi:hypothetical protein